MSNVVKKIQQLKEEISDLKYNLAEADMIIKDLKAENEDLIKRITKIFACLIEANRTNKITITLWVDNITTLWDYIAQTLKIDGDQTQIEEQILQFIKQAKEGNNE